MVWLALVLGCGEGVECGPAQCADLCARRPEPDPAEAEALRTDFEHQLLDPVLGDVRLGVRAYTDESIGICTGKGDCEHFLGVDPEPLPEGDYMVRAELRVPAVGEKGTWRVEFDTTCTYTRTTATGQETSSKDYSRGFDVIYTGEDRGFRLQPLRQIKSPTKTGSEEACDWTLTAPHPDGAKTWSGSWVVPAAD